MGIRSTYAGAETITSAIERILKRRKKGVLTAEIAEKVGSDPKVVYNTLRRLQKAGLLTVRRENSKELFWSLA